ncbi:MAG: hypothetical protein AUJ48_00915 [Deltaproteobacteria bacterium CG1_02_45_11]|nr:MAG: hypothetical protein AUJ48_00915 [Deltaproteobacteria bacterium CG1_02_45_11]
MNDKQLYNLIRMDSTEAVLEEVRVILDLIAPNFNTAPVASSFVKTVELYKGNCPGYQSCNTEYHDLRHITDTFIAMARLVHGAVLNGKTFNDRQIVLGLVTALLHDTGYIQEKHDHEGTGAKYTSSHIQRSIDFLQLYGAEYGLSDEEILAGRAIILCTDLAVDISTIKFSTSKIELLGKMLGTADLLAQMADRTYLEKLLFLYHEFKEAEFGGYENELDLLRKTIGFYDFIAERLKTTLNATNRFMVSHFASRWNIQTDLYHEAIEKQKNHLKQIVKAPDLDYRSHLKRDRVVEKIRKKFGDYD